jgi:tRNA 5-methylaminomethyl-2-thiouridine biosynthesis bifunctional protein
MTQLAWFKPPHLSVKHSNQQAVVIGGGLAGAQIAWHLAERGWKVTLLERHARLATEASGNKAGVISPKMTASASLGEDFYYRCFRYAWQQLQILQDQTTALQPALHWHMCGVLQLNHNEREQKRWQALKQRLKHGEFSADFLQCVDAKQATQLAGIDLDTGASYFPQGGWVDPRSVVARLCSHQNIAVKLHHDAIDLCRDPNNKRDWLIKDAAQKTLLKSQTVIIANGKDVAQFALSNTSYLPFVPVLGQSSEAVSSTESRKLKRVMGHTGYLTPAIGTEKKHLFGASYQRHQLNINLDTKADHYNQQQLQQALPQFSQQLGQVCSSHAAIRMTTPDRFPYVGAIPDIDYYQRVYADIHYGKHWQNYPDAVYQQGLFIFTGFASRGISTTGLCAKYLATLITAAPATDNSHQHDFSEKLQYALHPARFLIRDLKRGI